MSPIVPWDHIRTEVRSFRASVQPTVTTIRDFCFDSSRDRIYFLANDLSRSSKSPMLFRVDLPRPFSSSSRSSSLSSSPSSICSSPLSSSSALFASDTEFDTDNTAPLNSEVAQHTNSSTGQRRLSWQREHRHHRHDHLRHHHRQEEEDQETEDLEVEMVPFNPDSYQFFATPAPPIHIISSSKDPVGSVMSSLSFPSYHSQQQDPQHHRSFSASSSVHTADSRYPHNVYTAEATSSSPTSASTLATSQILAAAPVLDWIPILTEEWLRHSSIDLGHSQADRLSFYQFEPQKNRLMFPYGAVIYTANVLEDGRVDLQPVQSDQRFSSGGDSSSNRTYSNMVHNALSAGLNLVSVSGPLTSARSSLSSGSSSPSNLDKGAGSTGARTDPRLGGSAMDLIAFTRDQDIWVSTTLGVETQLTFCSRNTKKSDICCGIAEFVMQEEFHRSTNYYWAPSPIPQQKELHKREWKTFGGRLSMGKTDELPAPTTSKGGHATRTTEKILYLQVSEAMVDLVVIPRQGMHPSYEEYRYPHAGTPNAVSDLQIVEFLPRQHEEDEALEPLHKRLWGKASLYKLFPWLEYIVRFGWMPDGKSVWVQMLDRRQQMTALVAIPLDCFMSVAEKAEATEQTEHELASRVRTLYEEQSNYWINVTDIMHLFPPECDNMTGSLKADGTIRLVIASERTGYRHLYMVINSLHSGSAITPITAGPYQVVDRQITVDSRRQLVYFTAKRDSVLETHLYVASFAKGASPENVRRLTELGYSHQTTVDVDKGRFLTLYSSMDQSPACAVMYMRWSECRYEGQYGEHLETGEGDSREEWSRRPWCSCGCQLPKISSHAFVIRQGISNLNAKHVRHSPIVGSASGHSQGHMRTASESAVNYHPLSSSATSSSSTASRMDSALTGFRAGSMNSISGFLVSHLSSSLPKVFTQQPQSQHQYQQQNSSMVVSTPVTTEAFSNRRSSLKFASTIRFSGAGTSPRSYSCFPSSSSPSSSGHHDAINASHHPVGEFFTFNSSDNVELHGCFYRPSAYKEGHRYPTLVSIYGGPRSQMVLNEYKLPKFLRVFLATRLGLAVVMIDGRGSNDRGLEFEGRLRHQMGQIEIQDQVEGLQFLARPENGGIVDMDRVAISGWSYGGYLSLMALAQYPEVFKLAIAGAPVTQWELYNTAYTERYMGLVHENKERYAKSSVLHWLDKFPDSENRLLIAHGLIDENVHFKNTETLAAGLVRSNKPHQIQPYPTERHGLRDARVNEHFETLMFYWLKNYL
ncbi:dipeptidylpeptidase [Mortierella claussenii]|nr:dipeptidylpeptidase [Mortierella claussenii]